ncbi:MAG: preprotein translocase subunit SecG [Bacteroidales bacterium]|nr:preprotein translocase subunit SecG [Bacteroidales bacterium]
MLYTILVILIIIVCILLAFVVLIQKSKGGGLASNFASQNQIMGVRKTTDFVEKATWTLAIVLMVLCIISTATIPRPRSEQRATQVSVENNEPAMPVSPVDPVAATPVEAAE